MTTPPSPHSSRPEHDDKGGILLPLFGVLCCLVLVSLVAFVFGSLFDDKSGGHEENVAARSAEPAEGNGDPGEGAAEDEDAADEPGRHELAHAAADEPTEQVAKSDEPGADPMPEPMDVAEPVDLPPWQAALDDPNPPDFADVCFRTFDVEKSLPQADDLKEWFEPVQGVGVRFENRKSKAGTCGAFDGLARLMSPWPEDAGLRLHLEKYGRLQIHFFNGQQGVTLVYYENKLDQWAAYKTTREPDSPKPATFALTATDGRRNRRSGSRFGGPFEIRCHAGEVIMLRGDTVLLRAPLGGPPEAVYFEGRAEFYGIELVRTADFPIATPELRPIVAQFDRPADLDWTQQPGEGATVQRSADGSLSLVADNAATRGWIAVPLPTTGLNEVIVELEPTPGIGLLLSPLDARANTNLMVRFVRNTADGRLCVTRGGAGDTSQANLTRIQDQAVPMVGEIVFVRLVVGAGITRWSVGCDGEHWSEMPENVFAHTGDIAYLAVTHVAKAAGCRASIHNITLRSLNALTSLAAADVREQAVALHDAASIGQWLVRATQSQPADAELNQWRRACVIRSLAAGCTKELGYALLDLLLDDAADRKLPFDQQVRLLQEAVLLQDLTTDRARLDAMLKRFYDVALDAYESDRRDAYSWIRGPLLSAPLGTGIDVPIANAQLIRMELIQQLYSSRWLQTVDFCRSLRFYQQHQQLPIVDWADVTARREMPGRAALNLANARREEWRHPLVEELSKEAYNVLAELQAILDSEAFEDAARLMGSVDPLSLSGVAPMAKDRELLVSLPAAFRLAVREHAAVQSLITKNYSDLAQLRVRQAVAAGDASAVRLASIQFESTSAAAEGHQWLGDRALSSGWFTRALAEYERAEATATPAMRTQLALRKRLAAAMLGQDVGQPATVPVAFGGTALSADEFEQVVSEMLERGATSVAKTQTAGSLDATVPPPGRFVTHVRGKLDGSLGERPTDELTRHVRQHLVHWTDRQLAAVREGDMLYVSNRFQVAAFDLNNGARKWQSPRPPGKMLRSQEWSLTAMRPLIVGSQILVRQLYNRGPMLVCLDKNSGQIRWSAEQPVNEYLVSDVWLIQDRLVGLTLSRGGQQQSTLRLTVFGQDSGEVLEQHDLLRLREAWWRKRICRTTALDDAIVATLGGAVVCCDITGHVRWIRKQASLPTEEESTWVAQAFDRPLLHDGRLYVTQPSVRTIECIDPETGKLIWKQILPDVERLIGIAGGAIVVRTADGMRAFDRQSGEQRWIHEATQLLDAALCGERTIVYSRQTPAEGANFRPQLVWLDAKTGRATATANLPGFDHPQPRFAMLLPHKDRLFAFAGRGQDDPNRDFIELARDGEADVVEETIADLWTRHVAEKLHTASSRVLPGWTVLNASAAANDGLLESFGGESNVLSVSSAANSPIVLARRISLDNDKRSRLRIRVGHPQNAKWHLQVAVNGKTIWEGVPGTKFPDQIMKDVDVDLTEFHGQTVWLAVHGRAENPAQPIQTLWKRLEIASN